MSYITTQELRDASADAGTLEKFTLGKVGERNINRYGYDVSNLATINDRALEIARQAASMQTYLSRIEMEAAGPQPKKTVAQVTNDPDPANNGNWVSDGSQWVWSGIQPANSAAIEEVERGTEDVEWRSSIRVSQAYVNLASAAKSAPGYYANLGSGRIIANASTAMIVVPVVPGHRYRVRAISGEGVIGGANQLVGLLLDEGKVYERNAIGAATWVQGEGKDDFYVDIPVELITSKFLVLNTVILGQDYTGGIEMYDITASTISTRSASVRGLGAAMAAEFRSQPLNYADAGEFLENKYVSLSAANPNYGKLLHGDGTGSILFPVSEGQTYRIKASSYPSNLLGVAFKGDMNSRQPDTIASPASLIASGDSRLFTVPTGQDIRYAVVNVLIAAQLWDIRPGLVIESMTDSVSFFGGKKLVDAAYAQESVLTFPARARGKLWVAIGDSITEKNFRTNKNYHDYLAEAYSGLVVENRGISGSGFYDRYSVADVITSTPDLITVFLGTNDWGGVREASSMPLGVFGDVGIETVAGCIDRLLTSLVAKFPGVPIGVATPLPRLTSWGDPGAMNSRGYTLRQLSMLIIRYARHLSLPVIDLYSTSGLPVYDPAGNALFFTASGQTEPDGLHPNDAGHRVIARKFTALLSDM